MHSFHGHFIDTDRLPKNFNAIDGGAGIGDTTMWMKEVGAGVVVAVECSRINLPKVRMIVDDGIFLVEKALWSEGEADLIFTDIEGRGGTFYQWGSLYRENHLNAERRKEFIASSEFEVETVTIPEIQDQFFSGDIHYLKLDIEGAEINVLENLVRRPEIFRGILQVSIECHGNLFTIKDMLSTMGFLIEEKEQEELYGYR